jgi:serine/threonine protein kinase
MNSLTGFVPLELGNLVNLQSLDLSDNNLEGPLPHQLSKCTKMISFDVGFNFLNGSFPSSFRSWTDLATLILSENHFSDGIPTFLSEFENLNDLKLGGNNFGGNIPKSFGKFQSLSYDLNLSANGLVGSIPSEIGNLKSLQILDLSWNNLTGSIQVLDELSSLSELNISYNSFEGSVTSVSEKLTKLSNSSSSFLDNPGLCVSLSLSNGLNFSRSSHLKLCNQDAIKSKGHSKVAIVMIALGSAILVLLLLGLIYIFLVRKSKQEAIVTEENDSSDLLKKVMKATENLNDEYIIGRGAEGVVYKAAIGPDNILAVKKLVFDEDERKRLSMLREIETLSQIRHRNLVKLEGVWLKENYGLISYKYMPNGSLYEVLHEKNPPQSLKWNVRNKIAIGIAHGLAYLHYDCDPVIVHRDIKTSNILLDSDMEPHVADFGLAKLLDQSSSSTSTQSINVSGTLGYIAPGNNFSTPSFCFCIFLSS